MVLGGINAPGRCSILLRRRCDTLCTSGFMDSVHVLRTSLESLVVKRAVTARVLVGSSAAASIPSSYQTVVIDNSDKKGFLSKSKRFNYSLQAVC